MNTCDAVETFANHAPVFCDAPAVTWITSTDEFGSIEYLYMCDKHYTALLAEASDLSDSEQAFVDAYLPTDMEAPY